MSTASTCAFVAAYCDSTDCELFREGDTMTLYAPSRENYSAKLELGDIGYVKAEIVARELGFEPKCS